MRATARKQVADAYSMPAPVGGWNARDPLAAMKESEAVTLDNWFPQPAEILLRKGYTSHATGIDSEVETLATYATPSGVTMFAADAGKIYDVTSAGAAFSVQTGLSNGRWQFANMRTAAGTSYLHMVNGADSLRLWDGSTWVTVTGVSTPAITGVTTANLDNVFIHAERLWFVEKDSVNAWYLGSGSASGAATKFALGSVFKLGGKLVAGGSWTVDAGVGMDDHCVFVSSKGEVAVYKGYDPSSATTFALVGVFRLAPPIGKRCIVKYAGDLILITTDGAMPMSKALQSDRYKAIALTDKIRQAFADAYQSYGSEFGWEGIHYPIAPFLLFNIPDTTGVKQFAMNVLTGAWCRFTGMEASCWAVSGDSLYFGGASVVYKAWNGYADAGTDNITGDAKQAFNYFRRRGGQKRVTMARPILLSDGDPAVSLGWDIDYGNDASLSTPTFAGSTAGVWDSATWDSGVWGGDPTVRRSWQTAGAVGTALALRLRAIARGITVKWTATDVVYEPGGVL